METFEENNVIQMGYRHLFRRESFRAFSVGIVYESIVSTVGLSILVTNDMSRFEEVGETTRSSWGK